MYMLIGILIGYILGFITASVFLNIVSMNKGE